MTNIYDYGELAENRQATGKHARNRSSNQFLVSFSQLAGHNKVDDDDIDPATGAALPPVTSVESGSLGVGGKGIGSFLGFGMIGVGLARFSHPLGVALAAVGVARTVYGTVFARGHDVSFPADTAIQVQIAPGPARP